MFRTAVIALLSLGLTSASLYAADGVVNCTSRKVKETFRHTGLATVDMQMRGAAGDIAAYAADAKRFHREFATTDAMKTWHLTVIAAPASAAGVIQNIVLATGSTVVAPSLLMTTTVEGSVAAYATFTSPEARALVQSGDFQVVAELQAGRRSCDVSQKDRNRLGL